MSKENKYIVKNDNDIVKYLSSLGIGKNKIKTYVSLGYIKVNGVIIKKLPYMVKEDDVIVISKYKETNLIKIIYEDSNYLVVDKETGLLTISTSNINKSYEDTLYRRVREYLNKKREYAFIVNRIDKETSGIVIFVKNDRLKRVLQDNWNKIVKKRGYIAIVSGVIKKSGVIDNYLYEDKLTFTHSTKVGGKRAITNYKVIKNSKKYTMLDVDIKTGRKNQIRVHFSELNHPIVGDKKYYSKDNILGRLGLHHYEIILKEPLSGKVISFKSEVPREFYDLFN